MFHAEGARKAMELMLCTPLSGIIVVAGCKDEWTVVDALIGLWFGGPWGYAYGFIEISRNL
ncbi:hypothetical protein N7445_008071 [Penicillium cf. griseofulvum]|nr:hypothetical protein N7445_008071 [Penicillium cf. griseofulvum]